MPHKDQSLLAACGVNGWKYSANLINKYINEKMKILQINNFYNVGSTGKITADIHHVLSDSNIESIVCYGRGEKISEDRVYRVCTELGAKLNSGLAQITGVEYIAFPFSMIRIKSIIEEEKPDLVHLQCINGSFVNVYKLVAWLKKKKIKTLLTLHAEFMFTANCPHAYDCVSWMNEDSCKKCPDFKKATRSWFLNNTRLSFKKMRKSFMGFEDSMTVVSVSPWLCQRSKQSCILGNMRNITILNGVNTEIFRFYDHSEKKKRKTVLHVTAKFSDAANHAKGGAYVIELAKRMCDTDFVVAAKEVALTNNILPNNIMIKTNVSSKQLATLYGDADVTLISSKRETFSMPVAESLCCGTPVVGFRAGGPESIAIKEYTEFVEYGDVNALENAVAKMLRRSSEYNRKCIADVAFAAYSEKKMTDGYLAAYKELLARNP